MKRNADTLENCVCARARMRMLFPFDNTDFLLMSKSAFFATQKYALKGKEPTELYDVKQ